MAFEYVNAETEDIIDILTPRDNFTIKYYFIANYDRQVLNKVKTITIDINAGYVSVIKDGKATFLFPF